MTRHGRTALAALCIAAFSASAAAPPAEKGRREALASLARQAGAAFTVGDWPLAEAKLREELAISPDDPVASYNLACAIAAQQKDAAADLVHAIECGYDDLRRIRRDPLLTQTITAAPVKALLDDWKTVLDANLKRNITRSAKLVPKAEPVVEDALKLAYLCSFDERSLALSRGELKAISRWAQSEIFPTLSDADALAIDPWVLVVLPTRPKFNLWVADTYGTVSRGGIAVVGGAYEHDTKRLVAQDLGGTLRHEFMHVLHWRDMTRRGQVHPIWLQEGLCSLAEDYDLTGQDMDTGSIRPSHSWRTNAVIRMARSGRLPTIKKLITMAPEGFSGTRPLASYAEARTLMMYLLDRGKLPSWYESYCTHYREDSTGQRAFEEIFAAPLESIEKDYRKYVRSLTEIAENVATGGASMGVEVTVGQGEGPEISQTYGHPSFRSGDILLAMNGRPVRDTPELVRLLQLCTPGNAATFVVRRGKLIVDISVELAAK